MRLSTRGKWLENRMQKNGNVSKPKPASDVDDVPYNFRISVNILEGKQFAWTNPSLATSYVIVVLNKVKYRTGVRQNMMFPFYRENFEFVLFTTIRDLQRNSLWLGVMEPTCCDAPRLLGEASVELAHVWGQPQHRMISKWAQLTLPSDAEAGPVGYLKVDISVTYQGGGLPTPGVKQKIDDNLLLPYGSEQQPACYQIAVYRAYGVPCSAQSRPDLLGKPPSTCLRVTFSGLVGQTSTQQRCSDPMYHERVSLVEMFPNVCQSVLLEVVSVGGATRVLASTRLRLPQISHRGENGFLPTFGPSLLHMYGPWSSESEEDGPFHRGALLVTMKTIVPYYKQNIRSVSVEPVAIPLSETEWLFEDLILFCPVFEVSMLDKRMSGAECGVAVSIDETLFSCSVDQEYVRLETEIKQKKLHYTGAAPVVCMSNLCHLKLETFPVLQRVARLPDFRFRMHRNNVLHGIVTDLENNILNIMASLVKDSCSPKDILELLHCSKDDTAAKILKFLDILQYSSSNEDIQKYSTELDQKLVQLQKEKMGEIYRRITSKKPQPCTPYHRKKDKHCQNGYCKKNVKLVLAECRTVVQDLKNLIFKAPDGWPDITVWLLKNGSRVAYAKMAPVDVIHSVIAEQNGRLCGKIQTIYLKPIKCPKHPSLRDCSCFAGRVELLAWLGAFRQRPIFQSCLPVGCQFITETEGRLSVKCDEMNVECCIYIYRAKLDSTSDPLSVFSPFVRVYFMNNAKETEVQMNTVNPVWSELLRICCTTNTSQQRMEACPPEILVEIYNWNAAQTGKTDLLGRLTLPPVLVEDPDLVPSLEWHDVYMGTEHVGKIQMSTQLKQMTESVLLSNAWSNSEQLANQRSSCYAYQLQLASSGRESIPAHLFPANYTYKIDVYWWGLRDVSIAHKPCMTLELEDMVIKSTVITECKTNSNFPCDRISQTFQGNLNHGCSPLTVKLYECTTFGRTVFVGFNTVRRPQKYLVNWIPKENREEILFTRSIVSNLFLQVNRKTHVKRHSMYPTYEQNEENIWNYKEEGTKSKCVWGRLFSKEADEEEMTLLPIFTRERQNVLKKTEDDWWMKYHVSLNERVSGDNEPTRNRLTIYDSELEAQPGFSRFKDWCRTIKIYNGNKTGVPEKDRQLLCGYLKACIAIYEWPPPITTVAVNNYGVDLDRGYFDGHPDNEPVRYMVRVYAIKCSELVSKGFTTTSNCYVTVQCSRKVIGDRNSCVARSSEPVFGKMYELHCCLPEAYLLKISVIDCGSSQQDSLIGCTCIDLEDRAYTRHRSTVGLAAEYNINGPNKWRDIEKPSTILEQLCTKNHLPSPQYPDSSTVLLNGVEYKDLDCGMKYPSPSIRKESICLSILHKWQTMPICGYQLVPEHVETRTLYDPEKPGVEQGKIHLWVDMFYADCGLFVPPPVDITPRPAEDYELRVIVWDVLGVKLPNNNSYIYVKAWIGPSDEAQDTDIYRTSINGEGHFNWRMIFHFQYKRTERKLLLQDKGPFTEVTELFPPILIVEVVDIDAANPEDFLGTLMLDLSAMPRGARLARHCTPDIMRRHKIDLFAARSARGWWPLKMINRNTGNYYSAGMIDLELSLLTKEKALLMPAGLGRDPPSPLPDPIRQSKDETNFDWSIVQFNWQGIPVLAILGLICIGYLIYWDLDHITIRDINFTDNNRSQHP